MMVRSAFVCVVAETDEMRETVTDCEKVDTDCCNDLYAPGPLTALNVAMLRGIALAIIRLH